MATSERAFDDQVERRGSVAGPEQRLTVHRITGRSRRVAAVWRCARHLDLLAHFFARMECVAIALGLALGVFHGDRWEVFEAARDGRSAGVVVVGQWHQYRRRHVGLAAAVVFCVIGPVSILLGALLMLVPWPGMLFTIGVLLFGGIIVSGAREIHRHRSLGRGGRLKSALAEHPDAYGAGVLAVRQDLRRHPTLNVGSALLTTAARQALWDVPIIVVAIRESADGFYRACGALPFKLALDKQPIPGIWWWPSASTIMSGV